MGERLYFIEAAELMSTNVYDCSSCHVTEGRELEGLPQNWAPDLALSPERLVPAWIGDFMRDPQALLFQRLLDGLTDDCRCFLRVVTRSVVELEA